MDLNAGRVTDDLPTAIGQVRFVAGRHSSPAARHAITFAVFCAAFGVSLSAILVAAEQQKSMAKVDHRFQELDRDRNGSITPAELPQPAIFSAIDANHDGSISLEEARAHFTDLKNPQTGSSKDSSNNGKVACDAAVPRRYRRLKPSDHLVGRIMPEIAFRDIDGGNHNLAECKSAQATVIAVTSTSCPLSKRFLPTLARIEKLYVGKINFIYVNPISTDSNESIRSAIQVNDLKGPYVRDPEGTLLSVLGARSSTDCFVVDQAMTLRYRGAVDDQYGLGYSLAEPQQSLLAEALDAVLLGKTPTIAATDAPGCRLKLASYNKSKSSSKTATQITYHNRISRIMQAHCAECHHDGGVAPFALTSYQDVEAHAGMIAEVLKEGTMPPWFAAPQKTVSMAWMHDRSLSATDKADLLTWLGSDQAIGNPADAPIPAKFSDDWQMGTPDVLWSIPKPISVPASGVMPYQTAIIETRLEEDKWVYGFEIRPTAREVVHHIGVYVEAGPHPDQMGSDAESTGSYFALYVPGTSWRRFPEGCAKLLPKGAKLRFQIHYTPNGTPVEDQTQIGFYYAKQPPQHELKMIGVVNPKLKIPPFAPNHCETCWIALPNDIQIVSLLPHMHARGKAFRLQSISKSGEMTTLLDVPRYDFNWQLAYQFATPQAIPKGTKLKVTGWFDNSDKNPANPDPTKTVGVGLQSTDEMLVGYVEFIVPHETLATTSR